MAEGQQFAGSRLPKAFGILRRWFIATQAEPLFRLVGIKKILSALFF